MGSGGGGGGRGGRGGRGGGGGGSASDFNPTESIYTRQINSNLSRVKSGELNREESVRQYNSELRKAQAKLKSEGPNSYRLNQISAMKYAIRETKKL
jgi:hypothetical protein